MGNLGVGINDIVDDLAADLGDQFLGCFTVEIGEVVEGALLGAGREGLVYFGTEVQILLGVRRRAHLQEFLIGDPFQSAVGNELGEAALVEHLHPGAAHHGGALGDFLHPLGRRYSLFVGIGPDVVDHLRIILNNIGSGPAGVGDGVIDAHVPLHMAAQIVGAYAGQLSGLQGVAA